MRSYQTVALQEHPQENVLHARPYKVKVIRLSRMQRPPKLTMSPKWSGKKVIWHLRIEMRHLRTFHFTWI